MATPFAPVVYTGRHREIAPCVVHTWVRETSGTSEVAVELEPVTA
jgi:hypothetical protein